MSKTPTPAPARNMCEVISRMQEVILNGDSTEVKTNLSTSLNKLSKSNSYIAPEYQQWEEGAKILCFHLQEQEEEPWIMEILAIWRGEREHNG